MKRFFMLCFFTLLLVSSMAFAATKDFKYFSVNVPDGWTASYLSNERSVSIVNSGSTVRMILQVGSKGNKTLEAVVQEGYKTLNGTNLQKLTSNTGAVAYGFYFTQNNVKYTCVVCDNAVKTTVPDGWYYLYSYSQSNTDVKSVLDSVTFNTSSSNDTTTNNNTNGGGGGSGGGCATDLNALGLLLICGLLAKFNKKR